MMLEVKIISTWKATINNSNDLVKSKDLCPNKHKNLPKFWGGGLQQL